jgi:hypothetical protein
MIYSDSLVRNYVTVIKFGEFHITPHNSLKKGFNRVEHGDRSWDEGCFERCHDLVSVLWKQWWRWLERLRLKVKG